MRPEPPLQGAEETEGRSALTEERAIVDDRGTAVDVRVDAGTPHSPPQGDPPPSIVESAPSAARPAVVLMKEPPPGCPEETPPLPLKVRDVVATVGAGEHDPFRADLEVVAIGDRERPSARLHLMWSD
jgi:hypothetical protein